MPERIFNLCRRDADEDVWDYYDSAVKEFNSLRCPCGFQFNANLCLGLGLVFYGTHVYLLGAGAMRVIDLQCRSFQRRVLSGIVFCLRYSREKPLSLHIGSAKAYSFLRGRSMNALIADPDTTDLAVFIANRIAKAPIFICAASDIVELATACKTDVQQFAATFASLNIVQAS